MKAVITKAAKSQAAAYSNAVASAEMRNIRLIKSDFTVEAEGVGGDQKAWKRGYGCDVSQTHFDFKRKMVSGLITAEAWCRLGRKRIVSLKCKYIISYDLAGDVDEEAAKAFVERVGRFSVYPYFRAHFADATSQAGISLGPLPVMKEGKRPVPPSEAAEENASPKTIDGAANIPSTGG